MTYQADDYSKEVQRYVDLPWTVELEEQLDGTYTGLVGELAGCEIVAETQEEAFEKLKVARADWLARALAKGEAMPRPVGKYSGKIFIRTSKQLHEAVARRAAREGVSMSQWVSELLAREVGPASSQR